MKTKLHLEILHAVRDHRMIGAGDRVGVAVSGGADSVALLRLFEDLRAELGISLCVAHLNHGLRGAEADADEAFVAGLARELDVPFLAAREDVAGLARRNHWNLEDAGRRARVGRLVSQVARLDQGPDPLAAVLEWTSRAAEAAGLTDAAIDAELAAYNARAGTDRH